MSGANTAAQTLNLLTGAAASGAQTANLLTGSSTGAMAVAIATGNLGSNAGSQTVNIATGSTAGGTATKAVNIGTGATATSTIAIGNSNAATTVAITGGDDWSIAATGALTLNPTGAVDQNIATGVNTGGQIVNIMTGAAASGAQTVNLLTGSSTAAMTVAIATGNLGSNAGSQTVNIATGSTAGGTATKAVNIATDVNATSTVTIGSTATTTSTVLLRGTVKVNLGNSSSTAAICGSQGTGGDGDKSDITLLDCDASPTADYAERYPIYAEAKPGDPAITYGDIVAPGTKEVTTTTGETIAQLVKSSKAYQEPVAGIVSDNYGDFTSAGNNIKEEDNPMPVALVGRVPVNVTNEGGAIAVGDFITTSSTAGKGMKATKAGRVIGMALSAFNGTEGQVMVQVINTWYDPGTGSDSSAGNLFVENKMTLGVETVTVVDNGTDTSAIVSLTPTTSYVEIKCEDANGCVLSPSDATAKGGDLLILASIGSKPLSVPDVAGILNGTNPVLSEDDTAMFIYTSGKADNLWLQLATMDN